MNMHICYEYIWKPVYYYWLLQSGPVKVNHFRIIIKSYWKPISKARIFLHIWVQKVPEYYRLLYSRILYVLLYLWPQHLLYFKLWCGKNWVCMSAAGAVFHLCLWYISTRSELSQQLSLPLLQRQLDIEDAKALRVSVCGICTVLLSCKCITVHTSIVVVAHLLS